MNTIAGIYGVNFEHMPELKTAYGYFVVRAVILPTRSWIFYRFKRARWL